MLRQGFQHLIGAGCYKKCETINKKLETLNENNRK